MSSEIELDWVTADGLKISAGLFQADSPQAFVLLAHGWGDHRGRYNKVIEYLVSSGYSVLAHDLRGHGRSEGQQGYAPGIDTLSDDLLLAFQQATRLAGELPIFLYANSFGGLLALHSLLTQPLEKLANKVQGAIVTSPLLRLSMQVPAWKVLVGKTIGKLLPRFTLKAGIDISKLSRDERVAETLLADPYRHGKICAGMFFDILRAGKQVLNSKTPLPCPVLLMHGMADTITDCSASNLLAERQVNSIKLIMWPGLFHELHNETGNLIVFEAAKEWLESQIE